MADLSKYPDQALEEVLANPKATRKLKQSVQAELDKRYAASGQGRTPNPALDRLSGAPTGGAPGFVSNMIPSMTQLGDDLTTGIANVFTDPVGTAANILPGMAEHYTQRYMTPKPGQPWYSDAVNTFNADPFGAMMDVAGVGGVVRGLTRSGTPLNTAGRVLERADPVTLGMGGVQMGIMEGQKQFGRPVAESMAGSEYGMPRGAQRENLPEYLNTVGLAIEQNMPPTLAGSESAKTAKAAAGQRVGALLDEMEASGQTFDANDIVRRLEEINKEFSLGADVPLRNAVNEIALDVINAADDQGRISPKTLQNIKERYAAKVNYDSATPATERTTQEGYAKGTTQLREDLRADPTLREAYDDYGTASAVEDVTTRGANMDIARGHNQSLSPFDMIWQNTMPLITGQSRFQRARARGAQERGDYGTAFSRATERTPFGVLRQGAYASDMAGKTPEDQRWHVGRLWED